MAFADSGSFSDSPSTYPTSRASTLTSMTTSRSGPDPRRGSTSSSRARRTTLPPSSTSSPVKRATTNLPLQTSRGSRSRPHFLRTVSPRRSLAPTDELDSWSWSTPCVSFQSTRELQYATICSFPSLHCTDGTPCAEPGGAEVGEGVDGRLAVQVCETVNHVFGPRLGCPFDMRTQMGLGRGTSRRAEERWTWWLPPLRAQASRCALAHSAFFYYFFIRLS